MVDVWYKLRGEKVRDSVIRILMNNFDSYEDIFKFGGLRLKHYFKLRDEDIKKIALSRDYDIKPDIEKFEKLGIDVISLKDDKYPLPLKNIAKPPVFLYIAGNLKNFQKAIGVVGTRSMTTYGRDCCKKIVKGLTECGVTVISGLASGIDGVAHRETLKNNGYTIGVIGSGLDTIYPMENKDIWKELIKNGAIISEYPLGTPPKPYNFPMRNRIIVGLSKGVALIESKERGGGLITAEYALEEGRDVFVVPGDIFSPTHSGCNNLIKESRGKLITSSKDILDEYNWSSTPINNDSSTLIEDNFSSSERKVIHSLSGEKNLDEIILDTGIPSVDLLTTLMELELKGVVESVKGGKYKIKNL